MLCVLGSCLQRAPQILISHAPHPRIGGSGAYFWRHSLEFFEVSGVQFRAAIRTSAPDHKRTNIYLFIPYLFLIIFHSCIFETHESAGWDYSIW